MKKSEIYRKLQIAVIDYYDIFEQSEKLEVIRELMNREDIEAFSENQESKAMRGVDE